MIPRSYVGIIRLVIRSLFCTRRSVKVGARFALKASSLPTTEWMHYMTPSHANEYGSAILTVDNIGTSVEVSLTLVDEENRALTNTTYSKLRYSAIALSARCRKLEFLLL